MRKLRRKLGLYLLGGRPSKSRPSESEFKTTLPYPTSIEATSRGASRS